MTIEHVGTVLFACAVLHTFLAGRFRAYAHHFPEGSVGENLFHLLGEVEAVFVLWTGILIVAMTGMEGWHHSVEYIESRNFTEPAFVFVIMAIAATKPIVDLVDLLIRSVARLLPLPGSMAFFLSAMILGPLMGSFVTEPAAMTVTAMVLKRQFFDRGMTRTFMYATVGTLFVNVSIGGVLTNFAAPPVLMVAHTWHWSSEFMFMNFGWKAAIAVVINAVVLATVFYRQLADMPLLADSDQHDEGEAKMAAPWWVIAVHVLFLGYTVFTSHHMSVFLGGFIFFLGFVTVTWEFQEPLKLKESLLVGGFLGGLVALGGLQNWWLQPTIASLGELPLYLACTGLTAITDNAALTYLGSQVSNLSDGMKYALVAGAVTGGGLTVIANAPNPAGNAILGPSFQKDGEGGISPVGLLLGAIPPTIVAGICLWFL